jgi:hypothetical protein
MRPARTKTAGEIHRQHPLPQLDRGLEERRALRSACVVDQDGDRAPRRTSLCEGRLNAFLIGHVSCRHAMATAGERIGHALKCLSVTPQQGQHSAFGRQGAGDLGADAARRAGDQGMTASE